MHNPESVSIRQAVADDAPALGSLRWADSVESGRALTQPHAEFAPDFVSFVRDAIAHNRWVIWIAELDGAILAHAYVHPVEMVPRPGRLARRWGYVAAVYTVPEERNRGIGTRLLQAVIDWSREKELEFLLLSATEGSTALYERAGFARTPDAMELRLDLRSPA
jgi:GNAT superfamily N-acetyltransferase